MFHLFDRIYISNDMVIDSNFDRYIISKENGYNVLKSIEDISYGVLLGCYKSIDEIENFSKFIWSIKLHSETHNRKVIIYADDENFSRFMSIWFKSIFKNPNFETAWNVLHLYLSKEKVLKNSRHTTTATNFDIFVELNRSNFRNHFFKNDTNILSSKLFQHIKHKVSFELLLAGYLSNGSNKKELKKSILNILVRSLSEVVIEIKHIYIRNKNRKAFPEFAKDENFFSNSSLYKKKDLGFVSSTYSNVDIIGATDSDINKFKNIARKLLCEWDGFKETSDIVKFIDFIDIIRKPSLSDEDLDEIIDFEKNTKGLNRIFSSTDEEKINLYFLDFVLNSEKEDLIHYALK